MRWLFMMCRTNRPEPQKKGHFLFPVHSILLNTPVNIYNVLEFLKIIYRAAGTFTKDELSRWLQGLKTHGFYPVFVGLPAPDYVVKTSLKEAYAIWREQHEDHSVIGAVTIPERHAVLKDEDVRILDKVDSGVSYFISQCIFNVEYTKKILEDLIVACQNKKRELPTIIFTLTICGSAKTLHFMEWLGIHIPEILKEELKVCANPAIRSMEIAIAIAKDLIQYCQERSIPFGFNIESVATRKEEVDASLALLNTVNGLLRSNGFRQEKNMAATSLVESSNLLEEGDPR